MKHQDQFLEERLVKYDKWIKTGKISSSSKVIPVAESLDSKQWVLPTEQAMEILGNAKSVAVQDCLCRTHYKRCDKPVNVCLVLNDVADKSVSKGEARHVSMSEATDILKKANENGLVHLSLYMPDHEVFALCNCCECCCHDLQIIRHYNRDDLMVRSEYVAKTDPASCTHCGECIERCTFNARNAQDDELVYDPENCVGCGLCVTICPAEATSMEIREPRAE